MPRKNDTTNDSTAKSTEIVIHEKKGRKGSWAREGLLDMYLTKVCLEMTVFEVCKGLETCLNARAYFVATLVTDAIFMQDIDSIKQIVERIDGTVPDEKERGGYANIFGDALEDVLDAGEQEQLTICPDDLVVIALAKAVVFIALSQPGKNFQMRKQKNDAVDMVFKRTGGRKTEPTKPMLETTYEDPDWMRLPDFPVQDGGDTCIMDDVEREKNEEVIEVVPVKQ